MCDTTRRVAPRVDRAPELLPPLRVVERVVHAQACRRGPHVAHERLQHVQRRPPKIGRSTDRVGLGRQRQRGGRRDRIDLLGDVREVLLVVELLAAAAQTDGGRSPVCGGPCALVCPWGESAGGSAERWGTQWRWLTAAESVCARCVCGAGEGGGYELGSLTPRWPRSSGATSTPSSVRPIDTYDDSTTCARACDPPSTTP